MKTVAFVPAKGESDRIKAKNTAILDGEHLFKRKLRQLLECSAIDEVYLDTESDDLMALASDLDVKVLKRDEALASNATDGHELFANEAKQVEADLYIQCLCTSPFISADTLERAIAALRSSDHDSLVAVQRSKQYRWSGGEPEYGRGRIPNSVDLPETIVESMGLYMMLRPAGSASPLQRFGSDPLLFDLSGEESVDVNWPDDLALAERICAGHRAAHNAALDAVRPHLYSSLLSDICKDRGLTALLPSELKPISGRSILGRAKTLGLRPLKEGEDWKGIYDALGSYAFVRPGDVIVVQNQLPDAAYFGDLNANMAVRSGSVGAVLDSPTRDSQALNALEFSVFARGVTSRDIRYEGTVESMNKPVEIGGISIANGDYIFADQDGVVSIPAQLWPGILEDALAALKKEADIRHAILEGKDIAEVLKTHGAF